jgi:aspartate-semialdehyde dehydrogenase
VAGATGAVGEALLALLTEREFPIARLHALASGRSDDDTAMFAERAQPVRPLADFDFHGCDLAFFCVPAAVAAEHVPRAAAAGCLVIDASSQFRQDAAVPLIVPEVNSALLDQFRSSRIIASPGAPAVQLASVLAPLQRAAGLRRVQVTTLLAVSAQGRAGVAELAGQTARLLNAQALQQKSFPAQIAFNLIPQFDALQENGYTLEELQIAAEVKKLLADEELVVESKNIFAPVFYGHSQVATLDTRTPLSAAAARKLLAKTAGVKVLDRTGDNLSPVGDSTGQDAVLVGRIRQDLHSSHGLTLWIVADNIRKGAAVNIVQIAEALIKSHL